MKKSNVFVVVLCTVVLLLSAVFAVGYYKQKNSDSASKTSLVSSEKVQKEKGKSLPNAVRLAEGISFSFSKTSAEQNEAFEEVLSFLDSSLFDRVFVKTKLLSSENKKALSKSETKKLFSLSKRLAEKGLSVFFEVDFLNDNSVLKQLFSDENTAGVVLTGGEKYNAILAEKKLEKISSLKGKKTVVLTLSSEPEKIGAFTFENAKPDFVLTYPELSDEEKSEKTLNALEDLFEKTKVKACLGFDLSAVTKKKCGADAPLRTAYLSNAYKCLASRAFSSLADVRADSENCFSAVKEYLAVGIDSEAAFRPLSVEGYDPDGEAQTSEYKVSLNVRASNLFPLFLKDEELSVPESGVLSLDLSLKNGKNKFTLSQCGKKLKYVVNVSFDNEVIREISPSAVIYASPKRELKVAVTAAAGASVFVKAGARRYEAKAVTQEKEGYCVYNAAFSAPGSKVEIESIGKLVVTATFKEKTYTKEGPSVLFVSNSEEEVTTPITTTKKASKPKVTVENNVGSESLSVSNDGSSPSSVSSTAPQKYTGNQMCVVTSSFADTWPANTDDDSFVPYYTPLVKGTIDYVTGQKEIYDSEAETTRDFFTLATGRRVQSKDVMLVPYSDQGTNRISVASSSSSDGGLDLKLSMNWEVPYSFSFGPQSYFSAYTKKFNVNSFTANYIQFTFYYTAAAEGTIDVSQSSVISSASWSSDSSQNTVSLTLLLNEEGKYYGYSISREKNGLLSIKIRKKPQTLSRTTVVLDPGHGGSDGGAAGLSGAVNESQVNFALAVALKNELESRGAKVLLTRSDDRDVTLEERKAFARKNDADLFISVHCNASVNTSRFGTAAYYFRPMSEPLAEAIYEKMCSLFKTDFYSSDSEKARSSGVGTIFNPFSVTRLEECPSVLIETAFITNENECRLLLDASNRAKIAAAISDGVEEYLSR